MGAAPLFLFFIFFPIFDVALLANPSAVLLRLFTRTGAALDFTAMAGLAGWFDSKDGDRSATTASKRGGSWIESVTDSKGVAGVGSTDEGMTRSEAKGSLSAARAGGVGERTAGSADAEAEATERLSGIPVDSAASGGL